MKILSKVAAYLIAGGVALALGSCSKSKQEEDVPSFKVLKTEFASEAKGGEGTITLSEGGFDVSTSDAWVQASKSGEREVKLTVAPNTGYESRATNVVITKDKQTLTVPITQLGLIAAFPVLPPQKVTRDGGMFEIDFRGSDVEPIITFSTEVDWVSYKNEDGIYTFTVDYNPELAPARSVQVTVVSGLVERSFMLSQEQGIDPTKDLSAEYIPGYYKLSYIDKDNRPQTTELTLVGSDKENQFLVVGASFQFQIHFDPAKKELIILTGELVVGPQDAEEGDVYTIWAYNGRGGGKNGKGYHFIGTWDAVDMRKPKFTFKPQAATHPFLCFIRSRDGKLSLVRSEAGPDIMGQLVIEWQRPLPPSNQ